MSILRQHQAEDVHAHEFDVEDMPEYNPLDGLQPDPFLPRARV